MVQTAAGSTLAISATLPTTFDAVASTGYPSLTHTVIGEITDIPTFGSLSGVVNHSPLGEIDIVKLAGSRNHGSVQIPLALEAADAGQVIVLANVRNEVSFKLTLSDGAVHYMTGLVLGMTTNVGNADSVVSAMLHVEFTRTQLRVAAP